MKAMDLAYYIIKVASDMGKPVSNLKLLKILYFIHRDFSTEDKMLINDERFVAWPYGPVIPSVYFEFSINAARPIMPPADYDEASVDFCHAKDKKDQIKEKIQHYANRESWWLVQESHKDGGAWRRAQGQSKKGSRYLSQKDILEERKGCGHEG